MAEPSSDGKYVTVEPGDTLTQIAQDYAGGASNYKKLAAINNISNPDLIYVGQKIYLTEQTSSGSGTGSGGTTSGNTATTNKAEIIHFGLQSNADNTLFATWKWDKDDTTASYKVLWTYGTGDGVAFVGSEKSIPVDPDSPQTAKQDTYNIPAQAKTQVHFKVLPVSKTYKQNDVETSHWTAEWSKTVTYNISDNPPGKPGTPSVTIDKYSLTATVNGLENLNATSIEFEVVKDDKTVFSTGSANIVTGAASYSCPVDVGSQYKVRCRAVRGEEKSDWSDYSSNVGTMPSTPGSITTIRANSKTSIYLEWEEVKTATSYDLEYATKLEYFDGSDQTTITSGITSTHYEKTGLSPGETYFFRVRAVNDSGSSGWSEIKSVVLGDKPAAPTTWSSTTTAISGEKVTLYWVHNARDDSKETSAELELYVDGVLQIITLQNTSTDETRTRSYELTTSEYTEGTTIQWRVRTAGVTNELGDWSIQRTIEVNAPPTLTLSVPNQVNSFPFIIRAQGGPSSQTPISYHLSITADSSYEPVDNIGISKIVTQGSEVYSKHFDISGEMVVELSAGNIDLANNISYTVRCVVSMSTGLTAEAKSSFRVSWSEKSYIPNAEIGVNENTYTASIRPYCAQNEVSYRQVTKSGNTYTRTNTTLNGVYGEPIKGAHTTTGELVYEGVSSSGAEVYYCIYQTSTTVSDVTMSVYRREYDGSFTEIATGISGSNNTTVTDPHPALDYARYRIVATSNSTGSVSYYDVPGYPIGYKGIVIQWDEDWVNFDSMNENAIEKPPWAGSMLKLLYNVDVSDTNRNDVALIEYIGRAHPIAYYGTQVGQTSTWNVVIRKDDEETLYALRRLSRWMGDVYVREPSGSGYWANITVSFSRKHKELTIPVTLDLTRVEGGV
jgi:hypothetical protein